MPSIPAPPLRLPVDADAEVITAARNAPSYPAFKATMRQTLGLDWWQSLRRLLDHHGIGAAGSALTQGNNCCIVGGRREPGLQLLTYRSRSPT